MSPLARLAGCQGLLDPSLVDPVEDAARKRCRRGPASPIRPPTLPDRRQGVHREQGQDSHGERHQVLTRVEQGWNDELVHGVPVPPLGGITIEYTLAVALPSPELR